MPIIQDTLKKIAQKYEGSLKPAGDVMPFVRAPSAPADIWVFLDDYPLIPPDMRVDLGRSLYQAEGRSPDDFEAAKRNAIDDINRTINGDNISMRRGGRTNGPIHKRPIKDLKIETIEEYGPTVRVSVMLDGKTLANFLTSKGAGHAVP